MIGPFQHTDCLAILKWKQGERMALGTFRSGPGRLHVLFDMPPAGDFDHEKRRPLTPTEHIRMFGRRLRDVWGNSPAFVDAGFIDDDLHKEGLTRHPLTELLERGRLAGALPLPAVSLSHSQEYQAAVRRFVEWNPSLPICIRVESQHLDRPTFQSDLRAMLTYLTCEPSRVFLVLDFKALETISKETIGEFAVMLADQINELPFLHQWKGLAVALSSFPSAIKLKPGNIREYPRTDLLAYMELLSNPKGLLRAPMFGDYAVDTSPMQKPQRRTPSAHLRYSTPTSYVAAKGTTVKKPFGYEAIYPVADLLVGHAMFMGAAYSAGDRFINELHTRSTSNGNASKWRWASTDHHLTVNLEAIARLFGITIPAVTALPNPADGQGVLFEDLFSPATAPEENSDELAEPAASPDTKA